MIFLFRWLLVVVGVSWSLAELPAEAERILYADMRANISAGKPVARDELDKAITSYEKVASLGICMPGVREQLASFLSLRSGTHTGPEALAKTASDLDRADKTLRVMLRCSPFESNQWLSLAMLDVKRNGIRSQTLAFLNLSYLTGPREAWIIERRLTFAAGIAPLVPADMKPQLHNDIGELRRSRRAGVKKRFLKRLNLSSFDELERLFD